jgi:tRNA1Val (adenine37-N6)-methyltransferase
MFQFKQFLILQDHCAQKVSEVACIQGAWTKLNDNCKHVLDIGSGTGLLSLMIAQRYDILIDAIEIDEATYHQGKENIDRSPFKHRIQCLLGDIKNFDLKTKYDFVITNPPFFEKQLQGPNDKANLAKHSSQLKLDELLDAIDKVLDDAGGFSILFPFHRKDELEEESKILGYFPISYLIIQHSALHEPKVFIGVFSKRIKVFKQETFIIKENGVYTEAMKGLMRAYYLK